MNPKILASAPAWLKKSLAEKIMTETDPVKIREAQMALETIKRSEQMVGGGLTPEQAGALLQNLHRQVSDPALPPLPSMRQQPLDYAKGGSVPETRSVVRLPQKQREMNRAMNIIASQRHSPSMTSGAPTTRGLDALAKGLIGAPMIGALTASPMSGLGRSAIAKLAKMLAEGSRNPGVVGAGAGIGAATELLEDDPTLAGALTNAALGAADVAAPIPTLAGQVLGYSPEAEAGGGSLIRKGLEKWGRRAARGMADDAVESLPGQLSVVKPKGGNWLTGSVEDALKPLVPKAGAMDRSANSVMEEMLRTYPADKLEMMSPDTRATVDAAFARLRPQVSVQNWIEGPLTKYVKTRMASPDDEVRKLAEQGVLHFDPNTLGQGTNDILLGNAVASRARSDFPEAMAHSQLARQWENMSDAAVGHSPARTRLRFETFREKNPWLEKLDPETPTYHFSNPTGDLGFNHLIDELKNALNPDSGLPRNLQLTPEAVQNMSMEKAVRRVAEINDWRAAQKAEANRGLAEQASTVRDYPHTPETPNPKGLRWVELKTPEFSPQHMPDGYEIREMRNNQGGTYFSLRDKLDGGREVGAGMSPELALKNSNLKDAKRQALAEQLEYEGDTMGHCVGGYCDDVLSGNSRIFSLRDAKGEPHVTIEVAPEGRAVNAWVPEGEEPSALPSIVQIKGKQNRAPNPEYLPFVQDFVRNSPFGKGWADVGDLQNTGLTKHSSGKYISDAEATAMVQRHFGDARMGNKPDDTENPWQYANRIRRYDPDMLSDTDKAFLTDWEAGNFAKGGRVRTHFTPMDLHGIIAQLETQANA